MTSSMSSSERVKRFKQKQQEAGRRMVTLYLSQDALNTLRTIAQSRSIGKVVEDMIRVVTNNTSNRYK